MLKLTNVLGRLFFPVTLMTIVTLLGLILSIQTLHVAFTNDHTAAIYAPVNVPLTLLALFLYAIDRFLVRKIAYLKLVLLELTVLTILYFLLFKS